MIATPLKVWKEKQSRDILTILRKQKGSTKTYYPHRHAKKKFLSEKNQSPSFPWYPLLLYLEKTSNDLRIKTRHPCKNLGNARQTMNSFRIYKLTMNKQGAHETQTAVE